MIVQLSPPIPITCPQGAALAHFLIDYGMESHLHWVCFIDATGECWTYPNPEIRAQKNLTLGRRDISSVFWCSECGSKRATNEMRDGRWLCSKCLDIINQTFPQVNKQQKR